MPAKRFIAPVLLLSLLLMACDAETPATFPNDAASAIEEPIRFREDGTLSFVREGSPQLDIRIEIADTDSARTRGLMERTSLPEQSGMLFIFEDEMMRSFWMANTPLSLDILFVDADSQIVTIRKYTRPMSPQSVESTAPSRFVVEVPAGFSDTNGILEGDYITWRR